MEEKKMKYKVTQTHTIKCLVISCLENCFNIFILRLNSITMISKYHLKFFKFLFLFEINFLNYELYDTLFESAFFRCKHEIFDIFLIYILLIWSQ